MVQPKIIDVGSATGETLRQLYQAGYHNVYDVDNSADMPAHSFDKATLILSDKVTSSECAHALYYDYKRDNGVTEEEIEKKRQQTEGVLVTYPLSWYLNTLQALGFQGVEVINAHTSFVTFMARKAG